MNLALLTLKVMVWISGLALVLSTALHVAGQAGLRGTIVGLLVQTVILLLAGYFLRRGSRAAAIIFGLWCAFLFIDGITSAPSLVALINYGFAVLGFVGLTGIVRWFRALPAEGAAEKAPSA
ncbi:hypothetical protein OEZ71_04630 [Defluviimonas sp. WL0050]|uniref:Uncharacterized protein n=1 Tax=Albidovulum litorale TaxID=2984134 RepID=A0ABT2ZLH9_9RHOB|nr:hypothetical protein [Defluviimonas sp. WL0050]MCV2871576.1 hypothetical protein [Defluviimonas sp. WL0050]